MILDVHMASEGHPAANDNEHDNDKLDHTKEVLEVKAPFQGKGVDEEGGGNTGKTNATLVPAINLDIGGIEDVLAEHNTVAGGPSQ
jgi:hypothetical protein